jgi:hypothetical protein
MKQKLMTLFAAACLMSTAAFAQSVKLPELPEYVVITAENTKLLGGIGLNIDCKKSPYKGALQRLEDYIVARDENRVRTLTDLLNVMSNLGFEYINSFQSTVDDFNTTLKGSSDVGIGLGSAKVRNNLVFRKKKDQV